MKEEIPLDGSKRFWGSRERFYGKFEGEDYYCLLKKDQENYDKLVSLEGKIIQLVILYDAFKIAEAPEWILESTKHAFEDNELEYSQLTKELGL